jgi:hypothetical protein
VGQRGAVALVLALKISEGIEHRVLKEEEKKVEEGGRYIIFIVLI